MILNSIFVDSDLPLSFPCSRKSSITVRDCARNRQVWSQYSRPYPDGCFERHNEVAMRGVFEPGHGSS